MNYRLLFPVALLVLAACSKAERAEDAMADSAAMAPAAGPAAMAPDAEVEKAAAVYRGVQANPAAAESVLTAHGLTQAGFDSLMFEIAADSARAAAYASAIR